MTETGICYAINSALTKPKYGKELFCNRETGPGKLKMMVTEDIQLFINHPNDVPFAYGERDLKDTILWGSTKEIVIKVTEIINGEKKRDINLKTRIGTSDFWIFF
jgi:amiloride-sensitive sodium channel